MEGTMYDSHGNNLETITGTMIVMGKDSFTKLPSDGYVSAFVYRPPETVYELDRQGMCTKEYVRRVYD